MKAHEHAYRVPSPRYVDAPLTGHELKVTPEMRAQVFWLLRRYSSRAYIQRMYDVYEGFIRGFERWAAGQFLGWKNSLARETLRIVYDRQASIERGLRDLGRGLYGQGYRRILEGLDFDSQLFGRRTEGGICFQGLGLGFRGVNQPKVGIFGWEDRAGRMAGRTARTLRANWTYEQLLGLDPHWPPREDKLPLAPPMAPQPRPGPSIRPEAPVPFTGVWEPTVPGACPNFLVTTWPAPAITRATAIRTWDPLFDEQGSMTNPPYIRTVYESSDEGEWRPVWEDRRYEGGATPDESNLLLPDDGPPPYPAEPEKE